MLDGELAAAFRRLPAGEQASVAGRAGLRAEEALRLLDEADGL